MTQRALARLSYANVIATIALVISLGGGAYAAVSLPAHSVGARELREGGVGQAALSFGLGGRSLMDNRTRDFGLSGCPPTETGQPVACRAAFRPVETMRLTTLRAGVAFISAIVAVRGDASGGGLKPVVVAYIDQQQVRGQSQVSVPGRADEQVAIPYQGSVSIPAGHHKVVLMIWPMGNPPGTLHIDQTSLAVQVLPPAL